MYSDWQEETCCMLRIKNFLGKLSHLSHPFIIKVSQAPSVTERAKGDGNCFCSFFFFFFFFFVVVVVVQLPWL